MAATPALPFSIVSQVPGSGPDAGGQYVTGVTVTFRTPDGDQGAIFFPAGEYTQANVVRKIQEQAATMAAIRAAGSAG